MNKAIIIIPIIIVAIGVSAAISFMSEPDTDVMMDEPGMMDDTMMSGIEGNVNVGVLVPLTGDLASQGEEDRIAAELAIADFNEYLADKGSNWSISGVIEDSQTNPVVALDKVTSMHAKNAKIVIGPATSSNLRNISGYTAANDMMVISFGSTAPSLAISGDNIFRTVPDDNNQGPAIANLMASRGMEVLVPVWRGDTWGDGLKEATENSFEGVVGDGIRYNPEAPEFSASSSLLASQVQEYVDQYGADKVGILIIAFAEVTQFMQSAEAHDVLSSVKWFGSDGSTNVQSLVDDPIGLQFAYDTEFTTLQFAASGNDITQKVNDKIVEELGRVPTVYAYCTYDAIWLAGLAMEAANSTDTGAVIDNMLPVAADFVGSVGSTKLNAAGDLDSSEYAVWTIRDDQWLVIGSSSDMSMMGDSMMTQSTLEGVVDIGMLFPLSGDLASHGEERRISAELAVDDFNAYLADKGSNWSLNAIVEDSQTSPVIALEKVTAMHAKGAKVVVGPASSSNLRNLSGYATANNMILISYSSTAPSLAIEGDNIFRTAPDDNNQGPVISSLVLSNDIDVLVPVWRGDTWGDGLHEATARAFTEAGGILDDGIRYNPEVAEFASSASLLAEKVEMYSDQYGAENVGVLILSFAEVTLFMQSASSHDVLNTVMWFGSDGSTNEQSLVEDPIGLEFAQSVNFTTVQFAALDTPAKERVTEKIMSEFGRIPNVYAYGSYDAVWLAGLAMEAAGTTDTAAVKANLIPVSENHIGAVGSTKLNAAGDLNSTSYAIWTIQDGKWTILGNAADLVY